MRLSEIDFLELEDLEAIHSLLLEAYGGSPGYRRAPSAIKGALVALRQSSFTEYPTLSSVAAAYAVYVARNRPFVDGNERTALLAAVTFLKTNGLSEIHLGPEWVRLLRDVAQGNLNRHQLTDALALSVGMDIPLELE